LKGQPGTTSKKSKETLGAGCVRALPRTFVWETYANVTEGKAK
jgi:hypothetical protein